MTAVPPAVGRMPVDRARLDRMLNPRTVVVVGEKGPGYQFLKSQLEYRGNLYSVQIDEKEIPGIEEMGVTNLSSLGDVPGEIDLVISAVPRPVVPLITRQAIARGAAGVHFFTAGFAETGDEQGLALQEQLLDLLREDGMPAIGPNCMGVYNRALGLRFHPAQDVGGDDPEEGSLAILSQSGTHGVNLTVGAQRAGVRVGRTISFGNALVVSESDLLAYLRDDASTNAIAIYLEGAGASSTFSASPPASSPSSSGAGASRMPAPARCARIPARSPRRRPSGTPWCGRPAPSPPARSTMPWAPSPPSPTPMPPRAAASR